MLWLIKTIKVLVWKAQQRRSPIYNRLQLSSAFSPSRERRFFQRDRFGAGPKSTDREPRAQCHGQGQRRRNE